MHRSRLGKGLLFGVLLIGLMIPLTFGHASAAAKTGESKIGNSITINPLGFVGWGPDIEYEGVINPGSAIALRGKFGGWTLGDWKNTSVGGGLAWRFFLQEENPAPRGLWVGPAVDVLSVTSSFQNSNAATTMLYSIYGQLGYKWLFGEKVAFVLSPFMNVGYNVGSISIGGNTLNFDGFLFGIGMAMGVAF